MMLHKSVLAMSVLAVSSVFPGCASKVAPEVQQQFVAAQEAFDKAQTRDEFLRVAGIYEQIARQGIRSGTVYYNQGNAFVRAGEQARAIAAYRMAKRYRPSDPLLDANLRSTLKSSGPQLSRPFIEHVLFWQNWMGYETKFHLSILLAGITLALGIGNLIVRRPLVRTMAVVGLLMTLAAIASASYDWYRFDYLRHGVLIRDTIARKGNGNTYEPAFTAPLPQASEFLVFEQRGDWLRVRVPDGQEGWLPADEVVLY